MQTISRDELRQALEQDPSIAVVEVLGADEYNSYHLPRAINVPFSEGFEDSVQQALPDKSQKVVVYCKDSSCTASPKAAERLERLGYEQVYDYAAGKVDWKQAGLPVEAAA